MPDIAAQHVPERAPPRVFAQDGKVFAVSRDVAAFFEKNHRDVLRDVRNLLIKEPSLGERNFAQFTISDLTGPSTSHYEMDRDGFMILAMGFTGAKALRWKLLFIEAFNQMEEQLRAQAALRLPETDDEVIARGYRLIGSRLEQAQAQLRELAPKAAVFNQIADTAGCFTVREAAKLLHTTEGDLKATLVRLGWIFRQGDRWLPHSVQCKRGHLEHKVATYAKRDGTSGTVSYGVFTSRGITAMGLILQNKQESAETGTDRPARPDTTASRSKS